MNYLERRSVLYQYQFGFRKGHSTAQAIAEIADNLKYCPKIFPSSVLHLLVYFLVLFSISVISNLK